MFVKEFVFSFSLLAFTGILMVVGIALLVDAIRRFGIDAYRRFWPKVTTTPGVASTTLTAAEKTQEELPTLEEAA